MLERTLAGVELGQRALRPPLLPLEARELVFEAGGRRLIDGIDLVLQAGLLTVIMGPNGAGKSLTLRLLHGLLRPTAGRVLWDGQPLDRSVQLRQAMVFQRPVSLRRSVLDNVLHALRARGVPRRERRGRAEAALGRADLRDHLGTPARRLSGGEQQRLALARALALEPEILFLDEPSANLDPASALLIELLVAQAHAAGTKIVLVTHDLGQAKRLADEVIFLHRGRLLEQTPADRFFDAPASPQAQAFVEGRIVL